MVRFNNFLFYGFSNTPVLSKEKNPENIWTAKNHINDILPSNQRVYIELQYSHFKEKDIDLQSHSLKYCYSYKIIGYLLLY